jgi:hypothetical protein
MCRRLGALLLAAGLVLAALPAVAAPPHGDFTGGVPGAPGKTWIDLLSQIFPDIAASSDGEADAGEVNDVRSIGSGDDSWVKCGDKIHFRSHDARPVRLAGRDYAVVTVTIEDECVGLIGLFGGSGKLVDAVNVRGDIHVSFSGDYVRPLGAGGALVIAHNWHDNSEQSYDADALILVKPDGFSAIGNVLAFGARGCGENGKPGELLLEQSKVRVAPNGDPLARIEVTVTRSLQKLAADDCNRTLGQPVSTIFTGSWRWNAEKNAYEAYAPALDSLSKWNEKRF